MRHREVAFQASLDAFMLCFRLPHSLRAYALRFGVVAGLALAATTLVEAQSLATCDQAFETDACDSASPPAGLGESCIGSPDSVFQSPFAGDLWERPVLLGDLAGWRSGMADSGYTFNVSTTQFYQGVASGGINQDFSYFGRNDYIMNVDGE